MRKIFVILCALLMISLLVGCAVPKEQATEKEDTKETEETGTGEQPKVEEKEDETPTAAEKEDTEEEDEKSAPTTTTTQTTATKPSSLPSEISALFEKSKRAISMSFLRAGPETQGRFLNTHNIKGKNTRIDLYPVDAYKIDNYFDTVYLDTEAKTATARCREKQRCISRDIDNTKKIFNVTYSTYRLKTPYEWIQEVKSAEIVGPEVLDTRSTIKIKYSDGKSETEMWVDESYGVALKVKIIHQDGTEEIHQFKDVVFNSLKDSDVVPEFS